MFSKQLKHVGTSKYRTVINTAGNVVNITRKAATAGINMVGSDLQSMLPIFGNIVEQGLSEGRVIVFHKTARMQGIVHGFKDVVLIGGGDAGARLNEGDGEHLARYLNENPDVSVFVNLLHMHKDSAARLVGEFAQTYAQIRGSGRKAELIATFGLTRIMTRKRYNNGDTQAVDNALHQQLLSDELNIRILNAVTALSEIPQEFHTNTPNIMVFKISTSKHWKDLASHLPEDQMDLIKLNANNTECGVMHMGEGYATYFNPTDLPHSLIERPPYIIEATKLVSRIGESPDGNLGNAKRRKAVMDSLVKMRADRVQEQEDEKERKEQQKALDHAKRALLRRNVKQALIDQIGLNSLRIGAVVTPGIRADSMRTLNQISDGRAFGVHVADRGHAYPHTVSSLVLGVAAYQQTGGKRISGQDIDFENAERILAEVSPHMVRRVEAMKQSTGLRGTPLAVAAHVLGDEAWAFMDFLTGKSESARKAITHEARLRKGERQRCGANDAIFTVLLKAWDAEKSKMLAANDDRPIANAA